MTAKDLIKWQVEPVGGSLASPLGLTLRNLQDQLQAGQFADALRSIHDSFAFLTMFFGGVAVGSLRSVAPAGPDLTLLLDEPPTVDLWARLLKQAWQDWSKHPHHPALEALRQVFFASSRLQSSRFGARRHSRWLGLDARFPVNGESLNSWSDTLRRVKNINPEAAARQLVMKLPLLNIWLRTSHDFFQNWTFRLDPRPESGQFRYLISREDCRFDTFPYFTNQVFLQTYVLKADGVFAIDKTPPQVAAETRPAPATSVPTAAVPAPTAAKQPSQDVGLQWDPVTKSYRLSATAKPTPPATPTVPPPAKEQAAPPPPKPAVTPPAAETPAKPSAPVSVEWDPVSNSYRMVNRSGESAAKVPPPAPETTPPPPKPEPVAKPLPPVAPVDEVDAILSSIPSLDDLLADSSTESVDSTDSGEALAALGLDFLGDQPVASIAPVAPAVPEESMEVFKPGPGVEELLTEVATSESSKEESSEPSLDDLLAEDDSPRPAAAEPDGPSLDDLLSEDPADVASTSPSLDALLSEEEESAPVAPSTSKLGPPPSLDLLAEDEAVVDSSLDALLTEVRQEPALSPEENAGPSLDDLLAEEESNLLEAASVVTMPVPDLVPSPSSGESAPVKPPTPPAKPSVSFPVPSLDELLADDPEDSVATPPPPEPSAVVPDLAGSSFSLSSPSGSTPDWLESALAGGDGDSLDWLTEGDPLEPLPPHPPAAPTGQVPDPFAALPELTTPLVPPEPVAVEPEPIAPPPQPEPVAVEPEPIAPLPEPEPVAVEPEPIAPPPQPEPVAVEPEPIAPLPEPEPVAVEPAPIAPLPEPEPVAVEPEPIAPLPEPEPVAVEPEPIAPLPEPEPVAVEPEPIAPPPPTPEPVAVEPEPIAPLPEPEPVAAEPEPIAPLPEPEPVAVDPEPIAPLPEPEPVAVQPEPVAPPPEPEPVAVEPEPIAPPPPTPEPVAVEPEPIAPLPEPEPVAAEPEPIAPLPEPEPVAAEPEPIAPLPEPEPVAAEPEPIAPLPEPEPVAAEPEPIAPLPEPEPVAVEPEPIAPLPEPEPVAVEPEPIAPLPEPEPVAAEPEPIAPLPEPEPVAAEPEPIAAPPVPEPVAVEPEPIAPLPEPEPVAVEPEPIAPLPEPEPVAVEPEPIAAPPVPEPVAVEPEPIAPPPVPEPVAVEPEPIAPPAVPEPVAVEPEPIAPPPEPEPVMVAPIAPPPPPEPVAVEPEPIAPPPEPEPVMVAPIAPPPPPEPVMVAPIAPPPPPPEPVMVAPVAPPPPPPEPVMVAPIAPPPPPPEPVMVAPVAPPPPPPEPVVVAPIAPPPPPPEPVVVAPIAPPPPPPDPVVVAPVAPVTVAAAALAPALAIVPVEEELEEYDSYQFDPNSGPPAPPWSAWSGDERARLDTVLQQFAAPRFELHFMVESIRSFINQGRSGYLLIEGESGTGKSFLGSFLESVAPQVHPRGVRVCYFKIARRPHGDYETFIESVNDAVAASNAPRTHRVLPLERLALHDLAQQYPNPRRQERFSAYLNGLASHNRGPVLIYLDELDRRHSYEAGYVGPADFLPTQLPDNVYLVISYRPDSAEPLLEKLHGLAGGNPARLGLDPTSADYTRQLQAELGTRPGLATNPVLMQQVVDASEGRLHFARLTADALEAGLVSSDSVPPASGLYEAILKGVRQKAPAQYAEVQHFLMSLCAAFEPMPWDDLDQWGSGVDTINSVVEWIPSALLQQRFGPFSCVDLGHESLRDFLINQNREAFGAVCKILTGWAVHGIQAAGELKLQTEQGREWARQTFYRLYRWSLLCEDLTVLEWVVRNKELQKKRIAISQALETSARPHQKLGLLDLWVECLRLLVEDHQRADLRDELAWAHNSRGLGYLNLNRRQRALEDLDKSVTLFETLVNSERQIQFRNGLAAAYNRRSEIRFVTNDLEGALQDSSHAVQLFTDLVEDMGRDDLRSVLALAHRNQSSVLAATGQIREASQSMEQAISIFSKLAEDGDDRHLKDVAQCHLQLAQQRQKVDQHSEAQLEATKAIALLNQLMERSTAEDVRPALVLAHLARGSSMLATAQADKSLRDFTKAVTLGTQLVDEGRQDQRDELAESYTWRAKAQLELRQPKESIRDLSKAVEFRQKLVAEGRADQTQEMAKSLLVRASAYRADKQDEQAASDLSMALAVLTDLRLEGADVTKQLLDTHQNRAELGIQLGRYSDVLRDSDSALALLKATSEEGGEREARLFSLRGEGHRRMLQIDKARADFETAIRIHTDLLQQHGGSASLLGLAEGYGNLSRVSLSSGRVEQAQMEVNRSVEALEAAARDGSGDRRAALAAAYSTRAEVLERLGQHQFAKQELQKALGMYATLVESEGQSFLLDEYALAFRRLAKTLLSLSETQAAREACEQSTKRYKELWTKDRKGPWLDEMSRTQVVNSTISVILKDYGAAEEEIQRSLDHFKGLLDQGKTEYFDDVFQTSLQRGQNLLRVGLLPKASDELSRLLELVKAMSEQYEKLDFREFTSRVLQTRAQVHVNQQNWEQAFNDFQGAIETLQPLVVEESQFHLGRELAELYRRRAKMLLGAGHIQPGLGDLSQAAQVLSILLGEGREELRRPLAQVVQERAVCYLGQGELVGAVEDLNLGIQLLKSVGGAEVVPEIAQMMAQRGKCYQSAQQPQLAANDFEVAVQLYTTLVENQGRNDLSNALAECLLSQLSLTGQGIEDPVRLGALVKAVRLVTSQTKEGRPPEESFVVDAVTAMRNSLSQNARGTSPDLLDSVTKLCEAVLQTPRLNFDWVNLTELLSACVTILDSIKGPRYVSFICLSCVSCGREVQTLGEASMPRLIYFLTLLGLTLGSERPGEQLTLVGNAFQSLLEHLAKQRLAPEQGPALRQLVTTWQQLPAGYPAAANVSRGLLTQMLRAT